MKTKSIILTVIFMIPFFLNCYSANEFKNKTEIVNTTVSVSENVVIKNNSKALLGFNNDSNWKEQKNIGTGSSVSDGAYIDAMKRYGLHVPLIRGFFHNLDWSETVGKGRTKEGGNPVYAYGMPEWIKHMHDLTPDVQFVITVNIEDNVENLKNMARYLLLNPNDEKAVDNNGVNWAQVRVDDGIKDPVNVVCFELGNETDLQLIGDNYHSQTPEITAGYADTYIGWCKPVIAGLKEVVPDIPLSVLACSTPNEDLNVYNVWNEKIINEMGADVDYIVFHYYYQLGFDGTTNANQYDKFERFRIEEQANAFINKLQCEKKPKLYFSEHAIWGARIKDDPYSGKAAGEITSLSGTLATAEIINRMANRTEVGLASYHSLADTPKEFEDCGGLSWGTLRPYKGINDVQFTVVGEYFAMAYDAFGDNVVKSSCIGVNHDYCKNGSTAGGNQILTVSAHTKDDEDGLRLVFSNQNVNIGHNITLDAQNDYKLEKSVVLTDKEYYADNIAIRPDMYYAKSKLENQSDKFSGFYIPPQSVVVLYLRPMDYTLTNRPLDVTFEKMQAGVVELSVDIFDNKELADEKYLYATVYDSNKNLVVLENIDILRQRGYLSFTLPSNGVYTLNIVGANGSYTKTFNVDFGEKPFVISSDISVKSAVNYTITVDNFVCNDEFILTVEDNESEVYYYEVVKADKGVLSGTIAMPATTQSGTYKLVLKHKDSIYEKSFTYKEADYDIRINAVPKRKDGVKYQLTDFVGGENIMLPLKNVSDSKKDFGIIAGVMDKNGKLIGVIKCEGASLMPGEEKSFEIIAKTVSEQPMLIKYFIWDNLTDIMPLNCVYYTR